MMIMKLSLIKRKKINSSDEWRKNGFSIQKGHLTYVFEVSSRLCSMHMVASFIYFQFIQWDWKFYSDVLKQEAMWKIAHLNIVFIL